MTTARPLADSFGRVLRDLRVSVTDRCNFRCLYCLPETEEAADFYRSRTVVPGEAGAGGGGVQGVGAVAVAVAGPGAFRPPRPILREWKPRRELLSFEELERVVRIFVRLGIDKVRLTGGEPLLRSELPRLVARLSKVPGIADLAMTTNGFLFGRHARALRDAGLRRVSFSLDSLDAENFRRMTGRTGLGEVLAAMREARALGLAPIKVNAVVIRGLNDHEIGDLAEFARREGVVQRFIEFMPLDSGRAWQRGLVVPGHEILARLRARFDLVPVPSANPSETARRWRFAGGPSGAEIGIIAPVTEPFCGHCNRIRLTADGQIRTCLFGRVEHDLKARLRGGAEDAEIEAWVREVAYGKEERHHIGEDGFVPPERSMSCIGG